MLKKIAKKNFFCTGPPPPPPPELHIRFFFSDSCTPVHWILFFLQIHVPRYIEFRFFSIFLSVAQAVGVARRKKKIFCNFFQRVKKLFNFWNFVSIKVAKSKLNHLGFYCKLGFLIGKSEKSENWNRNWVLIDGTPCILCDHL